MKKSIPKDDTSLTLFWSSISSFANHHQYVDTSGLTSYFLLICYSNGFVFLIKVGEQAELGKHHFWHMSKFGPDMAQIRVPLQPHRCTTRAR